MSNLQNELLQIIDIENSTPLSWYDWWNYWSIFIGIGVFVSVFVLLTISVYSMNPSNRQTALVDKQENVDHLVANILHQKALTL